MCNELFSNPRLIVLFLRPLMHYCFWTFIWKIKSLWSLFVSRILMKKLQTVLHHFSNLIIYSKMYFLYLKLLGLIQNSEARSKSVKNSVNLKTIFALHFRYTPTRSFNPSGITKLDFLLTFPLRWQASPGQRALTLISHLLSWSKKKLSRQTFTLRE